MHLLRWLDVLDLYVAAPGEIHEVDDPVPSDANYITPTLHRAQVSDTQPMRRRVIERPRYPDRTSVFELDLHAAPSPLLEVVGN
jgi:hypothetical protein